MSKLLIYFLLITFDALLTLTKTIVMLKKVRKEIIGQSIVWSIGASWISIINARPIKASSQPKIIPTTNDADIIVNYSARTILTISVLFKPSALSIAS